MTRPREYDAVKGGQNPPPVDAAILGGIEGVKHRFGSRDVKVRVAALQDALKYGDAGLDLVIEALEDPSLDIQRRAYLLLRERKEAKVSLALSNCDRWKFFQNQWIKQGHSLLAVNTVAISYDGDYIVSGGRDRKIKIWNSHTGKYLNTLRGHSYDVSSVAISDNGDRIVSGGIDEIKIWNSHTGECLLTLTGHSNYVNSVAISPDGDRIVSGSEDNTIKIWNSHTGECLLTLTGHSNYVNSVAISPDGDRIVSGSWDNTIKIWNSHTGECLLTLTGHSYCVNFVAISPDGNYIVNSSGDGMIELWGIPES